MDVAISRVREALEDRARRLGFGPAHAALLADHFLDAELRGARAHGLERMRWIASFPRLDPAAQPRLLGRAEGLARYDAAGSLGYVALAEALDCELADPPAGARVVVVSHCFPTGRLGYFAERAASAGLVCLLTASSTARLSHHDGGPPLLGTNPFCLALPGDGAPAVIDVSMGTVTYGDVLTAMAAGGALPESAARSADGADERDPAAVIAGRAGIRPFGGSQAHKAFALAAIVELLCGALGGLDVHTAVAILARPVAEPVAPLRLRTAPRRFPGDESRRRGLERRRSDRIDVPADLWTWLGDSG
jgi:hydroxycarboxylate dehydrogenase B